MTETGRIETLLRAAANAERVGWPAIAKRLRGEAIRLSSIANLSAKSRTAS